MKKQGLDSSRWLKHNAPMYSAPKLSVGWGIKVMSAIKEYPAVQKERAELLKTSRGNGTDRRPTERTILWRLPSKHEKIYSAVYGAILDCKRLHHGSTAIKIVRYRYWSGLDPAPDLRATAAALGLGVGEIRKLERMFCGRVARRLGYQPRKGRDGCVR